MKILFFVLALALMLVSIDAFAVSSYLSQFNTRYGTSGTVLNSCFLCHTMNANGSRSNNRNSYGSAWSNAGGSATAFGTIESLDSDGDSFINIAEITARTFPGDSNSFPVIIIKNPSAPSNLQVN